MFRAAVSMIAYCRLLVSLPSTSFASSDPLSWETSVDTDWAMSVKSDLLKAGSISVVDLAVAAWSKSSFNNDSKAATAATPGLSSSSAGIVGVQGALPVARRHGKCSVDFGT